MQTRNFNKPIVIGVSGGSSSGKSQACNCIKDQLIKLVPSEKIVILSLKLFYKKLTVEQRNSAIQGNYDLDHPKAFDFELLKQTLIQLKNKKSVVLNMYSIEKYESTAALINLPGDVDVVLVGGILTFYQPEIRDLFDMKIFVTSDADSRLARTIKREVDENGRPLESVLKHYFNYVKPAFEEFCLPTKKHADIILPNPCENEAGINLIADHLIHIIKGDLKDIEQTIRSRTRNQSECGALFRPH